MSTLVAFHGKKAVKAKYLARVRAHQKADEVIKGTYWQDGKGCAVGCTVHSSSHSSYETELGIPEWLARVEDRLFEGMPNDAAKKWPARFLSAIPVGADLEPVKAKFLVFILKRTLKTFDHAKYPKVKAAVDKVIGLYRSGCTDLDEYRKAREEAYAAAAYAAADAAYAAAAYAAAAYAAADAAADADAAYAAAAYAAAAYAAAAYAAADAREQEYLAQAEYLLKCLRAAKPAKKARGAKK